MGKNKNAVLLVIEDSVRAGVIEAQFLAIGRVIQTLRDKETPVSYTHLTLPTNREV